MNQDRSTTMTLSTEGQVQRWWDDNLWYAAVSGGVKHCGNSRVTDWSHLETSQLVTNMCSLNAEPMLRLPQARCFRESQPTLLFILDWNSGPCWDSNTLWKSSVDLATQRKTCHGGHPSPQLLAFLRLCCHQKRHSWGRFSSRNGQALNYWCRSRPPHPPKREKGSLAFFSQGQQRCSCSERLESFQQGNIQTADIWSLGFSKTTTWDQPPGCQCLQLLEWGLWESFVLDWWAVQLFSSALMCFEHSLCLILNKSCFYSLVTNLSNNCAINFIFSNFNKSYSQFKIFIK